LQKKKILVLSDHALSTSGVGTQTRHLINGLLRKGEWTFRQFGAAIKHSDYRTIVVNDDFIIKPIDGFGTKEMLRVTLATEKPDLILIFTDPRFFYWLFEMEDEIHQVCPIAWWHVWDNWPKPEFNSPFYESTDLINCHSHLTYQICSQDYPSKTNFVPHALPNEIFYPLPDNVRKSKKIELLGPSRKDDFVLFWVNRNARRKRPSDVIEAWSIFRRKIESEGKRDATLIMHTDPTDQEGPNLHEVVKLFKVQDSVVFSTDRIDFDKMNTLHNISDACINISYAEGFGLATLEAMQCGRPIIAAQTGGLTRQAIDHRDGSENGVALPIEFRTCVGSQVVPYIYEDYVSNETVASGIEKLYRLDTTERAALGEKARSYVQSEFSYDKVIDMWHNTLNDTIKNWRSNYKSWKKVTV
jgi:glycosyltransferase involved in cell wall biosynthesis